MITDKRLDEIRESCAFGGSLSGRPTYAELLELVECYAAARSAADLLRRIEAGYSAHIMGRQMARKDRDKLRVQIIDWLDNFPEATP